MRAPDLSTGNTTIKRQALDSLLTSGASDAYRIAEKPRYESAGSFKGGEAIASLWVLETSDRGSI